MSDVGSWDQFTAFVNRRSWAWNSLLGQEDERKLLGFLGTEVITSAATSVDITGIPSWVTQIAINLADFGTNGTSQPIIQLGTSGGFVTSGYASGASNISTAVTTSNFTAGFGLADSWASTVVAHGTIILTLEDVAQATWMQMGVLSTNDAARTLPSAGYRSLSGTLTQIRFTTVGGIDNIDANVSINLRMH
jgi:hypothetical protein